MESPLAHQVNQSVQIRDSQEGWHKSILTKLSLITASESDLLLNETKINRQAAGGRGLTVEDIKEFGMEPRYKLEVGGRKIYFAGKVYPLGKMRIGILAYIDKETESDGPGYIARSFYRSNSQGGSWRYLPGALFQNVGDGPRIAWYAKGYGESSLNISHELFAAICAIRIYGGVDYRMRLKDAEFLFAGTTGLAYHAGNDSYSQKVDNRGFILNEGTMSNVITPPHLVTITNPDYRPDFEKCIHSFDCEVPLLSDGIPNQVVYNQPNNAHHVIFQPVERSSTIGGFIPVQLPNGIALYYSCHSDQTFHLRQILAPNGSFLVGGGAKPRGLKVDDYVFAETQGFQLVFNSSRELLHITCPDGTSCDLIYGSMKVRCFESVAPFEDRNSKLTYLFHTDWHQRSMLASIIDPAPLSSLGIAPHWIYSRSLLMPLYEYTSQSGSYGDYSDTKGDYVSMWNNYLRKVPLIREFHRRWLGNDPFSNEGEPKPAQSIEASLTQADWEKARLPPAQGSRNRQKVSDKSLIKIGEHEFQIDLLYENGPLLLVKHPELSVIFQTNLLRFKHEIFLLQEFERLRGKRFESTTLGDVILTVKERELPEGIELSLFAKPRKCQLVETNRRLGFNGRRRLVARMKFSSDQT